MFVPDTHREAVAQAARQTFGQAEPEELVPLSGGLSALVTLKLSIGGRAYVLRIPNTYVSLPDIQRHFTCMRIATDLGIAPQIAYTDAQTGICITTFIEPQPVWMALREPELSAQLGALLRSLHAGPAFPYAIDTFGVIEACQAQLAEVSTFLPGWFQGYLEQFEAIKETLRPHLTSAPCHNDLSPDNLLFDGSRLWLIDWEAACMNDPLIDLASAVHWFDMVPEQEAALLHAYFGDSPTEHQRAKLLLMKQVSRCFYALALVQQAVWDNEGVLPAAPDRAQLPSFFEAMHGLGNGSFQINGPGGLLTFGLVIANESLGDLEQPTFAQAVALLNRSLARF
jgi:aminoglycoside phosphotransferase (APT) family kinase protein